MAKQGYQNPGKKREREHDIWSRYIARNKGEMEDQMMIQGCQQVSQ